MAGSFALKVYYGRIGGIGLIPWGKPLQGEVNNTVKNERNDHRMLILLGVLPLGEMINSSRIDPANGNRVHEPIQIDYLLA